MSAYSLADILITMETLPLAKEHLNGNKQGLFRNYDK
jgi:hypothetical protein